MTRLPFIILLVVLFAILVLRFQHFYQTQPHYVDGQEIGLKTTIQEEPDLSNKGQKFTIKTPANQSISVNAQAFPRVHYGEVVQILGKLKIKKMEDGRVLLSLYYPKISVIAESDNLVAGWANAIREKSKMLYESALPPTSASLLMGIVFGAKEHFSTEFFDDLKATGVLHVIAASGMNVTFVAAALLYTLGMFMTRRKALVVACLGIVFYVFLVGFQASIIRAAVMGMLAFGASILGRQHIAAFALLVSGYLMLLWQPGYLTDLGFQLSFMATLGILYLQPLFDGLFGKFAKLGSQTITTTLAAQLGTLPILLGAFGKFGLLSIFVNALVLWIVPIVMLFGSIAAIIVWLIPPLAYVLALVCLPFLLYFETVVSYFGKGGMLTIPAVSPVVWVGYYLLLTAVIVWTAQRRQRRILKQEGKKNTLV